MVVKISLFLSNFKDQLLGCILTPRKIQHLQMIVVIKIFDHKFRAINFDVRLCCYWILKPVHHIPTEINPFSMFDFSEVIFKNNFFKKKSKISRETVHKIHQNSKKELKTPFEKNLKKIRLKKNFLFCRMYVNYFSGIEIFKNRSVVVRVWSFLANFQGL